MERILYFIMGYVNFEVTGEQIERFLNLCKSRGVVIRKLQCTGQNQINGRVSLAAFFLLRPIRNKTKVHIRVTEKHGMPFFFEQSKKRKAFFLGVIFCMVLMFVLSGRIWNIHIEGNQFYSTPEILAFLDSGGIVHGMEKKEINCSEIAASVRQNYPEITWVSARIEGTRLILNIQEGIVEDEEISGEEVPCSLIADAEGTIVKMVTRAGFPVVQEGDTCKKGDLLVLGRLEIKNDSQEVVRYEYVHADADIYVERNIAYYEETPFEYEKITLTGKQKNGFCLKVGGWYLEAGGETADGWMRTITETPLRITENFVLPISYGKIQKVQYKKETAYYAEEQAKKLAREKIQLYEEKLIEKGLFISSNNVKIETNYNTCISRGTFTVIEKMGKEAPVEILEQP